MAEPELCPPQDRVCVCDLPKQRQVPDKVLLPRADAHVANKDPAPDWFAVCVYA